MALALAAGREGWGGVALVLAVPALCCVVCAGSVFCFPVFLKEAMEEQAPPDADALFLARAVKCGAPPGGDMDKALAKYWVWCKEFPATLTLERGYGLRLLGSSWGADYRVPQVGPPF